MIAVGLYGAVDNWRTTAADSDDADGSQTTAATGVDGKVGNCQIGTVDVKLRSFLFFKGLDPPIRRECFPGSRKPSPVMIEEKITFEAASTTLTLLLKSTDKLLIIITFTHTLAS